MILRVEAGWTTDRAGNEQDPDAFTRNDHGAAALAWMRGTAVALGVGRADEGPLLLARALTHWIDLQRQGAQAQVQTEGGASDGPSAAMRMAGGRPMGPAARAQIPGHDAAWELTWYLGAQMRLAAAHWRNDEAGQETWLDLADYYERLDGPTREDSAAGARWLAHCVALWPKDDNGGRTGPAPGR